MGTDHSVASASQLDQLTVICQPTPGSPLCSKSNSTPAGSCLQRTPVCHLKLIFCFCLWSCLVESFIKAQEPSYQRNGSPSSSNHGVFTASLTSGRRTCCICACGHQILHSNCGYICRNATCSKMIKGARHQSWQLRAPWKQHL